MLDKKSFVSDGVRQVYSINTSQIATLIGVPLTGSYLQLVDNQPGGLGVIELPHLDAGPFLSYGIQWITFGVIAPILLGYFVYAEVQARRADKARATQPRGQADARDRRRQAHRPLRTATLRPATTNARRLHRPGKPHGAAHVGHRRRQAFAEGRSDLQLVVILGGPAESHAQCTGERRFDNAGVGAGVSARIAAPRGHRAPTASRRRPARTPLPAPPSPARRT